MSRWVSFSNYKTSCWWAVPLTRYWLTSENISLLDTECATAINSSVLNHGCGTTTVKLSREDCWYYRRTIITCNLIHGLPGPQLNYSLMFYGNWLRRIPKVNTKIRRNIFHPCSSRLQQAVNKSLPWKNVQRL